MTRPNLLFLYTDEQRFDTLAAYGNPAIAMPNLDGLAARSTVFEQAYVTQPVCTPSRSSLLTGLYPHSNGCLQNNIPLRPETPCLPELLEPGAYACAHVGKWHLGDEIYPQHGFETWLASEDTYHRYYSDKHDEFADRSAYHHWLIERGVRPWSDDAPEEELQASPCLRNRFFRDQIHQLPDEVCRPRFLAEAASNFIRQHAGTPFALHVNFLEPHMPFHSCRDSQYDPAGVTVPGNFAEPFNEGHTLKARFQAARYRAHGFGGQPLQSESDWRRLIAQYWGMCSLVDAHVGSILQTLADCGVDDNTIVVFTSDHGDMMASHRLLGKGLMFEESSRVPLLIRAPGQEAGRRVAGPVSQIDVVPTLLDLMGQGVPGDLPGRSLRPFLDGRDRRARDDVFIEWNLNPDAPKPRPDPEEVAGLGTPDEVAASVADPVRTVVTADNWKFNYSTCGEHELYDLGADPLEMNNLAHRKDHADRVCDLAARIRRWQQRLGDTVDLSGV